jgi:hypothetical protein
VRLHNEEPRPLAIADPARFFQIGFCLASKRFHGAVGFEEGIYTRSRREKM